MVNSGAKFDILVAAPQANGFLGARGIMGHVPSVYTHLLSRFWGLLNATGRAGYGNFDTILDHLCGISRLFTTPHTPWTVFCLVSMLIGC